MLRGGARTARPPIRSRRPHASNAAPLTHAPSLVRQALQRLKRATNQVGHLRILRNRKTFENNHDKSIRKMKESLQRQARARRSRRAAERL